MIITEKLGKLTDVEIGNRVVDVLTLEWFETTKRIMQKKTAGGIFLKMRFLKENPNLAKGDIIYMDDKTLITIDIEPIDVIAVNATSIMQAAGFCYEIGNKHLPLFYEANVFLIPFDQPLFSWLSKAGYEPLQQKRQLLHPLKTSVEAHGHTEGGKTLFNRIMEITNSFTDGK